MAVKCKLTRDFQMLTTEQRQKQMLYRKYRDLGNPACNCLFTPCYPVFSVLLSLNMHCFSVLCLALLSIEKKKKNNRSFYNTNSPFKTPRYLTRKRRWRGLAGKQQTTGMSFLLPTTQMLSRVRVIGCVCGFVCVLILVCVCPAAVMAMRDVLRAWEGRRWSCLL